MFKELEHSQLNYIKEINVVQLFGYYTYKLSKIELSKDLNKLIILYGDNGSCKTTILKLIFYLLSNQRYVGHKGKLANYKFKEFSVLFANGIEIGAKRKTSTDGEYNYYIKEENKIKLTVDLKTKKIENSIHIYLNEDSKEHNTLDKMYEYIKKLNISLYYLPDDRKTINTLKSSQDIDEELNRFIVYSQRERLRHDEVISELGMDLNVNKAMSDLSAWIKQHAIKGSRVGEENTITVYTKIIKDIVDLDKKDYEGMEQLIISLDNLIIKTKEYSNVGLITSFEYNEIRTVLKTVEGNKKKIISKIIEPFIESLKERLNALEYIKNIISNVLKTVNDHFIDKEIKYNMYSGFKIMHSMTGENIKFDNLSSGEKQLLLLIANTILASEEAKIFIIDEPEISLNIKWQRKLIKTLLDFSKSNNVQFLIATHSIELLTSYSDNVLQLKSIEVGDEVYSKKKNK